MSSKKVIFTGYIKNQNDLTVLYDNCFGYIHGHEFGGTNPTMINALFLNCQILALDTVFNKEMLVKKKSIFFNKILISKKFDEFENIYNELLVENSEYTFPEKYSWKVIVNSYKELFLKLTNSKSKEA